MDSPLSECETPIDPQAKTPNAVALIVVCLLVLFWQNLFFFARDQLDDQYRITAASGIWGHSDFVYFSYYLDLFPVAAPGVDRVYSRQGAKQVLRDHPQALVNEEGNLIRGGEFLKTTMLTLLAKLKGDPRNLDLSWLNHWVFSLALIGLLFAAWWQRKFLLGLLLVLFIGSHPLQLFEVNVGSYDPQLGAWPPIGNVFSWPVSTALLLLALHFPLIFSKQRHPIWVFLVPILSGVLLGTVAHIRTEAVAIIVSPILCYLLIKNSSWLRKALLVLLLLGSFFLTRSAWEGYFHNKIDQSVATIEKYGGTPLKDTGFTYHNFWHAIWCGLGDFDTKYGYIWKDTAAYAYAIPLMQQQGYDWHPEDVSWSNYIDSENKYNKLIWVIPGYEDIIREKVVGDITRDPLWYADILLKRIKRVFSDSVPLRLGAGGHYLDIPFSAWIFLPLLLLLLLLRKWDYVLLCLFSLPLSATAILVYSDKGNAYYAILSQIAAALICFWAITGISRLYRLSIRDKICPYLLHLKDRLRIYSKIKNG